LNFLLNTEIILLHTQTQQEFSSNTKAEPLAIVSTEWNLRVRNLLVHDTIVDHLEQTGVSAVKSTQPHK
ncbi:MAG: hypothetical protein ABI865_15250, partial [Nitrosospira sp.]